MSKVKDKKINLEYSSEFTHIIRPKRHLFEVNLKEVWQYRDLLMLFVRRDFVAKYKQTILGPFWFVLNLFINKNHKPKFA